MELKRWLLLNFVFLLAIIAMILILGRENNFYKDVAVSTVKYNDSTSARET